jgi:hypothetical protein
MASWRRFSKVFRKIIRFYESNAGAIAWQSAGNVQIWTWNQWHIFSARKPFDRDNVLQTWSRGKKISVRGPLSRAA